MAMIYLLNGVDITGRQFEDNGAKYSADWVYTASSQQMDDMGIVRLTEVHRDLGTNEYEDGTYSDDLVLKTRTYTVVTKTRDQINAEISSEIAQLQSRIDELTAKLIQ